MDAQTISRITPFHRSPFFSASLLSMTLLVIVSAAGCGSSNQSTSKDTTPEPDKAKVKAADNKEKKPSAKPKVMAGMGIMVGEVTSTSAIVQLRLTSSDNLTGGDVPGTAGVVEFLLTSAKFPAKTNSTFSLGSPVESAAEQDFIARASFAKLSPGTQYICETQIGADVDSLVPGPVATFKTLPGADAAVGVRFVVVTGMNYAKFHGDNRIDKKTHVIQNNTKLPDPYAGKDKRLGYPALESILKLGPDFFIGTGDNVYYDTPRKNRAKTVAQMRQKWHQQFVQQRFIDLFAKVPTYWEIDDHDYRIDDCDNSGDYQPSVKLAKQLMFEQLPFGENNGADPKTYRTHRVSRDLQIWFVENRIYRSPNKMPDGPKKTIWGAEQKAWLKKTLSESDATFKVLISPNPMVGPDDLRKKDNHTNIGGFRHERDEFFKWLSESQTAKQNFFLICGDRHWQYQSIHPSGVQEFSCGALVDANSRLGRKPGDPKSTDPDGTIKQVYAQKKRSGGFLLVELKPGTKEKRPTLSFVFHDENGKVLYRQTKFGSTEARP